MPKKSITQAELKELLDYNPETGVFIWKVSRRGCRTNCGKAGMQAGSVRPDGRRVICFWGRKYLSSRLAWFYMYGVWPEPTADHKDGDYTNDRIDNLRELSFGGQVQNRGVPKNNRSGVTGVNWYKPGNCWRVRIKVNGKDMHVGYYEDFDAAVAARKEAESLLHPFRRCA